MADALYIDASELKKGSAAFKKLIAAFPAKVSDVLNASALDIEVNAKRNAPANIGTLRQNISADVSKPLQKRITANTPYAAYVEFGTGKYAAQHVSTLPAEYKTFAAQFRGSQGKMSIKGILFFLTDWFHKHGIDKQHAFFIARSIFKNGIHPHPFLIPALIEQKKILLRDMQNLIKTLKIV